MASASDKGRRGGVRIGKYEVQEHIATGGMGAVYRAVDTELGRDVALKVLAPELAARPVLVQRFHQEAKNAAKLRHANIVALYEFGEVNDTHFLALEFVDGEDLHDYVLRQGRLDPEEARQIILQAARALDHAHGQGIVHRDIKPSNFLIARQDGRPLVKLTDLGLARAVHEDELRHTRIGTTVGTVDYMAPEQARDSRAADIRSDIYALGCTLYFLLTGHPPFPKGSLSDKLIAHAEAEPPDVCGVNPAVPPDLAAVLAYMIAKRQEDRFQTPAELLEVLENLGPAAGPQPPRAPPPEAPTTIPPPPPPEAARPAVAEAPAPRPGSGDEGTVRRRRREVDRRQDRSPRKHRKARAAAARGLPSWWPWAAGGAGVGAVLVAGLALLGGGGQPPPEDSTPAPPARPAPRPVAQAPPANKVAAEPPVEDKSNEPEPAPGGPAPVYRLRFGPSPAQLRKDYEGLLADFPPPAGAVPLLHVSRLPGPDKGACRSLASALARVQVGGSAIIEIADNGTLFEPALPSLAGRNVVVRPAPGYRPLLVWDAAAPPPAGADPDRFLALDKGRLVVQDLDIVVKWNDARADRPAALFRVKDGDLALQRCSFSVAGQHPEGTIVALLEGDAPCRCRLTHCYLRGGDLTALHLANPRADVLVDDCLVAGGDRPLVQVRTAEAAAPTLRLARSTLVCGRTLLDARPAAVAQRRMALNVRCCDSLLAQDDPRRDGVMVRLGAGLAADRLGWQAANSVYAGWKGLLAAPGRTIPATALQSQWWQLCGYREGDKALFEPWPRVYLAGPEDVAPGAYDPVGTPAHFAALTRIGPVGCDVAALPSGRPQWPARTYDRLVLDLPSLPAGEVPPVPAATDGLYHGESVKLSRIVDLGRLLQDRLAVQKPAATVVFQLSGRGEAPTSPIRLHGASLVLAFDSAKRGGEPLTLVPIATVAKQDALIAVDGGDLDLVGARVIVPTSRAVAAPRHLLKVQGGSLRLFGCRLQGPLAPTTDAYQGLIDFAGQRAGPAPGCTIRQSLLLSAGAVLHVRGGGARLRLHQSLALAADDLLVLDLAASPAGPGIQCALENCTLAVRRTLVDVRGIHDPNRQQEPVLIRADATFLVAPFNGPDAATLLRCDRGLLGGGLVLWQGKGNAFDKRLHTYLAATGEPPAGPQPFPTWRHVWGTPGEQAPLLVDMPSTSFHLASPHLHALALPRTVHPRPGEALPGADLARLGITAARR